MKMPTLTLLAVIILAACVQGNSTPRDLLSPSPVPTTGTIVPPFSQIQSLPPTTIPTSGIAEGCVPPLVVSGYPIDKIYYTPSPEFEVLPKGWDSVSTVPKEFQGKYEANLLLARKRSGHDEFWVMVKNDPYTDKDSNYLTYRTDTKEWTQAPIPPAFGIFLDRDNGVWADVISEDADSPILYRLDEFTNMFIPITDNTNLLHNGYISSNVEVDSSGWFWFVLNDNEDKEWLYSFDPKTLVAKSHLLGDYLDSIAIDKGGNVYLLQQSETSILVRYDPPTDTTITRALPPTEDLFGESASMYLNTTGQLWVSDRAWIDIDQPAIGTPYVIVRSSIFIDYISFMNRYVWYRPEVVLQSSDGRLWYRSTRGNAWFKPDTGEWCLFTTYGGNIVEDSDRNLWMMIENTLYELKMTP